jgi:glycosyltransferase involved in cell wall biosynthesis
MATQTPIVSVVIPTHNRATFVAKAIDSVFNQRFTDYEVIGVDDGSTDATRTHLRTYGDRINYIYQPNAGVSAARNTGITASRGTWLAFLDSDDEWKPDYLAKQMAQVNGVAGVCMQATNCLFTALHGESRAYFDINGAMAAFRGKDYALIERPFCFVITHVPWHVSSTIVRRDAITKAGLFDPTLTLSGDLDLMARVSLQGPFGMIKDELVDLYRRGQSTECLTDQVRNDPLGARALDARIYQRLKLIQTLHYRERQALNRVIGANKRATGNLLLQTGHTNDARGCYKDALFIDPSIRSLGRYVLSYLPTKASPV